MKTAILTGFEAFGNYAVNPTATLAKYLDGKVLSGHLIHSIIFPTVVLSPYESTNYGEKIIEESLSAEASVIISLGIASEANGVRVESKCINWVENDKYCTEFENRKPLSRAHISKEKISMPLQLWNLTGLFEKFSAASIPFEMSEDAGSYCCNAIMYRTLQVMRDFSAEIPFIFAHVPCTEEAIAKIPEFDRSRILFRQEALVTVVEKFLESYHEGN